MCSLYWVEVCFEVILDKWNLTSEFKIQTGEKLSLSVTHLDTNAFLTALRSLDSGQEESPVFRAI